MSTNATFLESDMITIVTTSEKHRFVIPAHNRRIANRAHTFVPNGSNDSFRLVLSSPNGFATFTAALALLKSSRNWVRSCRGKIICALANVNSTYIAFVQVNSKPPAIKAMIPNLFNKAARFASDH